MKWNETLQIVWWLIILGLIIVVSVAILPLQFAPELGNIILIDIIFLTLITVALPIILSRKIGWGKGLFFGAIISAIYDGTDAILKANFFPNCHDWCGFENILFGIFIVIYFLTGLIILLISRIKLK